MEQTLNINTDKIDEFTSIANVDIQNIPLEYKMPYTLAILSLTSKQCNEPYEILLSNVLNLENNDKKHGWDAFDNLKNPSEFYEFKPSSNTLKPAGTINDDTIQKIEKYEQLEKDGKQGWVILAGINKKTFTFDSIYKFPAEIYSQDRRKYLNELIEKNKLKEKQTRSTYMISVNKSIKLCQQFKKIFYVWKRVV